MTGSADLIEGWKALEAEKGRYETALAYFRGTVAEKFANERLRKLLRESDQGYRFRLAAIPVKVMAKRCRIAGITADSEAVAARVEEIRLANKATVYEPMLTRKVFMFGDAYALAWPVEAEQQDAVDGEAVDVAVEREVGATGVEISYQSPLNCRVMYDGEDGRRPRFAIRRWLEASPLGEAQDRWRAEVWYHDRFEAWITKQGASGSNVEDWLAYAEDETGAEILPEEGVNWPVDHDWDELPIKHARTDMPYGEPAHIAAYGPQDAITKAITTQVLVDIEAHGWRERYRILRDSKELENGGEPVRWNDAEDATDAPARGGPSVSARVRGSGVEHVYPGTEAVGEYAAPDPGELIAPVEHWVKLMSVVTETPLNELDATVQLSGVSREKADAPLRAKERDAKAYLEGFWVELYSLAVRMSGIEQVGTLAVSWAPPEVTMDADWWTTAQTRIATGVPVRQVLLEANYLPDQVDAWLDSQGEELALMQRIAILERLGAAVQTLGVGVQMGVLDQATVGKLVERIVGEVQSGPGA